MGSIQGGRGSYDARVLTAEIKVSGVRLRV